MDLRQLSALVSVAEHGSFSAAAEALKTVQSNVSAHIARLERELGALLVDRQAGQLTEEGQVALGRARRVAEEIHALVAEVAGLSSDVAGTVRVGMIGTTARWLAPQLIELKDELHPSLRLVVAEGTTTSLEPQLASGNLDLAVLNLPVPGNDVETSPLFEEDLVLVVRSGSKLARCRRIDVEQLTDLDLLLPMQGTALRDEIDSALRHRGISLVPRVELDGVRLIASLTFEGLGPAILPATAVPGYLRSGWRLVSVDGLPRRSVGVAKRRRAPLSSAARTIHSMLGELVTGAASLPEGLHAGVSLD
jgi:DNA-binding transcriptional LysR family regulator